MTRFSVKLKNILGLSYYRYELTSSTYNATIDTAFTITVKVTDVFGNNVNNKAVTLYHDGTSVSTQNTNSNGVATWNITPTTWGIHDFKVSNQHCYVNVGGSKTETVTVSTDATKISGGTKSITASKNDNTVTVYINMYGINLAISDASADYTLGTLPNGYKPQVTVYQRTGEINDANLHNSRIKIDTDGNITVRFVNTISGSSKTFRTTLSYNI